LTVATLPLERRSTVRLFGGSAEAALVGDVELPNAFQAIGQFM
jgi:hypothetical protein